MPDNDHVKNETTEISSEMKRAYLNYAMSVIVSRALPDVRDGLKPVHRRILYAMHRLGLSSTSRFSKSAKVVGEVLGKYHPHGDAPVYDALVRMAQDFSMRYPLIRGQGNFGSIDGDPPAAMRYTEVKLERIAEELLVDIDRDTVSWGDNFDQTLKEPLYLPSRLPNLLLMGAEGIAVGMATKIPPHNLSEVVDGLCLMIDKASKIGKSQTTNETKAKAKGDKPPTVQERTPYEKEEIDSLVSNFTAAVDFTTTLDDLMEHIKGPDFPTGGLLYGADDIHNAFATGRGALLLRARITSEDVGKGKKAIIVAELPFQVNKANLVAKIADLVRSKKVVGISDLRDESDREGIRVVIELKRDAVFKKVVNNLYKHTDLQTTFATNMVVLVQGIPQTLPLKSILEHYLKHRIAVITRRSAFELAQAAHRAHILEGLLIALDHIDEVVDIIKRSATEEKARTKLMSRFGLTQIQSQAILDMQLKRLTGLERGKIKDELKKLKALMEYLGGLLADVFKILGVVRTELLELKKKYGDKRRTVIYKQKPGKFSDEQLVENREVIVTLTKEGYIKQVPRETFKVQKRGGKGVTGFAAKEGDDVFYITSCMTHDSMLFFTNQGKVYQTRVWDIPKGTRTSRGKAMVNVVGVSQDEHITSVLTYSPADTTNNAVAESRFILMCTKQGTVKKTPLSDFKNIRESGIIAIKLTSADELLWARITDGKCRAVLATQKGKAIVFDEHDVRPTGRSSMGVRGIALSRGDEVTSMDVFDQKEKDKKLIVLTQRGIGKKTKIALFRKQKRGGKGVKIAGIDERTGQIAFSSIIISEEDTMIITSRRGQVVKIPLKTIPTLSRAAKGVILMRFSNKTDKVASATFI